MYKITWCKGEGDCISFICNKQQINIIDVFIITVVVIDVLVLIVIAVVVAIVAFLVLSSLCKLCLVLVLMQQWTSRKRKIGCPGGGGVVLISGLLLLKVFQ